MDVFIVLCSQQVAIFKLSPESGERVGLALTILLAYAVYLSLISESIPQTSLSASLLCTFIFFKLIGFVECSIEKYTMNVITKFPHLSSYKQKCKTLLKIL
jgi:hypothetical protein